MKYGEIQAVVQLAVALNVGIFALVDLVGPYIDRLILDLEKLHKELKDKNCGSSDKLAEMVLFYIRISQSNRDAYDKYALSISLVGVIAAFGSLWMLVDTARFYNDVVPTSYCILLFAMYLPTSFGLIIIVFTRWLVCRMLPRQ